MATTTEPAMSAAELLGLAGMVAWEAPVAGGALVAHGDPTLLRGVAPRTLADLVDQLHEQDRERLLRAISVPGGPPRAISYRVRHPERGLVAVHATVVHRATGGQELVSVIEGADPTIASEDAQSRGAVAGAERFMHICSHDMREPLRMVTGFLGLLAAGPGHDARAARGTSPPRSQAPTASTACSRAC